MFVMENQEGFDRCVGLTRKIMVLIGIWPNVKDKISWYRRCQFLIPLFLMIFFINIPQTCMLFLVYDNLNLIIEVLTRADLVIILTCFKLLGIWHNKEDLNYILIKMAEDWKETDKKKLEVMLTNARISNLIIISLVSLALTTLVIFYITQMFVLKLSISGISDDNNTAYKQLLFVSKFPFNTDVRPVYEIIWIFQIVTAFMATLVFASFDSFFIFSILHLCGQLKNLRADVKHSIAEYQATRTSFAYLLSKIVERHIQLNRFTYCIENSFNVAFLMQMLGFSVMFCLQAYQFVEILTNLQNKNIVDMIFIICLVLTTTSSIFFYCLIAEKLRDENIKFSFSFYDIIWYNLNWHDSKMLINIVHVTRNPPSITAGKFFEFSFEYFMTLMKSSLGYLSMLFALKQRLQA